MSGMPLWARRGAKVKCVATDDLWDFPHLTPPSVGEVYTIRRVGFSALEAEPIISFEEHHAIDSRAGEIGFDVNCFRPLIPKKTEADDMAEHFNRLLHTGPMTSRIDKIAERLNR